MSSENDVFPTEETAAAADLKPWYCIRSQPRGELLASRCLPLLKGVEVFYPIVAYTRRSRHGIKPTRISLFPNYLFARFPLEISKQVSYTLGVSRILKRGLGEHAEYAEVPQPAMDELFSIARNGIIHLDDPEFRIGQKIKIIAGTFIGTEAEVVRLAPAKQRVAVLLEILGEQRPVDISLTHIDIIENNPRRRLLRQPLLSSIATGSSSG